MFFFFQENINFHSAPAPNLCGCIIFSKMISFAQTVVYSTFTPGIKTHCPDLQVFISATHQAWKNKCGSAGSSAFLHVCTGRWGDREKQSEVNRDNWRVAGTGSVHVLYNCVKTFNKHFTCRFKRSEVAKRGRSTEGELVQRFPSQVQKVI